MSSLSTTTAYWYKESPYRKYHDTDDCPMAQYFDKPGSGYKKVTKQSELPEGYTLCGRCRHSRRRRPRPW